MTRIVAGTVGGRSLTVPPSGTRPTSERVREAMFSRLEHLGVVDGARVLDLFAGSGALGLEAASRGAAEVVLVDAARQAADVARRNAADLGLGRRVRVLAEPAERAAARLAADGAPSGGFDLVLIDPPYDLDPAVLNRVLADLAAPGVLAPDAVVVLEQARRGAPFTWPDALTELSAKRYGDTVVHYAEPRQAEEDPRES
ncbi:MULTISPECIES: 16S rRNA (guanine(966)-N(2))-methyltransferase RsmD [Isoptericola]|uniref:16S rRNA (Guanine(966)-N(2))-methyltransferase RsmD n=1 Tax=Isoptericola haloaureus TaxID=1542902 RepID=A0ABU7ZBE9_9MICO|nr:16S rRNA (guanine(966)-N(2))-methyltransferase RsmD [Isoptericola sp. AK164]